MDLLLSRLICQQTVPQMADGPEPEGLTCLTRASVWERRYEHRLAGARPCVAEWWSGYSWRSTETSRASAWEDHDVVERGDGATVITTDRLVVRPWRLDEADRFFDIYRRLEAVRWLGAEPMQDRREATEMIERNLRRLEADSRFGSWAVADRSSGVPVGSVILKPLPDGEGEIEIGWQLHPDSWGNGFASEAAGAVLGRGLADGLPEVWAVMYLDNHRSAAVCRRIGMQLLGITRRWYHEPSLMFWRGCRPGQEPSLGPDQPGSAELQQG
jgi:RimJ/RimL family protein N-acetyltransferase